MSEREEESPVPPPPVEEAREPSDAVEQTIGELEHDRDELADHIDETREDWEHKQSDSSVPGALDPEADAGGPGTGGDAEAGEAKAEEEQDAEASGD